MIGKELLETISDLEKVVEIVFDNYVIVDRVGKPFSKGFLNFVKGVYRRPDVRCAYVCHFVVTYDVKVIGLGCQSIFRLLKAVLQGGYFVMVDAVH